MASQTIHRTSQREAAKTDRCVMSEQIYRQSGRRFWSACCEFCLTKRRRFALVSWQEMPITPKPYDYCPLTARQDGQSLLKLHNRLPRSVYHAVPECFYPCLQVGSDEEYDLSFNP